MAKRFIDTEIFEDPWFMDLTPKAKLFFIYLITNCSQAGIIDLNIRLAEFLTGIDGLGKSLPTVWQEFKEKKPIKLEKNYYFLPNFIRYQYPNGLSANVNAQRSIITILNRFNIDIPTLTQQLGDCSLSPQDIRKDIRKDIYKDTEEIKSVREKEFNSDSDIDPKEISEIASYFGFSEIKNPDKFTRIYSFLKILQSQNQISLFRDQFPAYRKFKEKSQQTIHSFSGFIGTIENKYMDGGWNSQNWVYQLAHFTGSKNNIESYNDDISAKLKLKLKSHVG